MLNQELFIKRLHKIFDYYGLTAATFADEIKVQRSSISHLLSGRNKPSLEFVMKITSQYKEVTMDWLLHEKGTFPKKNSNTTAANDLFSSPTQNPQPTNTTPIDNSIENKKTTNLSEIERIVVFYKNGTFKEYLDLT